MSGFGATLSRHVLGMKFMRKTRSQLDNSNGEKAQQFAPESQQGKAEAAREAKAESSSATSSSTPGGSLVVEELWSYNQCERYIFGRQSFGGFNPTVENNVKKGIWKPFYLDEARTAEDSDEDEDSKKQSDVDVSDEEMAKTYGSLVGTLAKRFKKRFKKDEDNEKAAAANEGPNFENRKKKKPSKWTKKFQRNKKNSDQNQQGNEGKNKPWNKKRQRDSTGSTAHFRNEDDDGQEMGQRQQKSSKRQHGYSKDDDDVHAPAQKKRKFMKPSDD